MDENKEGCSHDCSSCSANCASRDGGIPKEKLNEQSSVKHVIGVVSGKGGVGKSIVTSLLSVMMNRRNHSVAILDADITGPSIPKAFGTNGEILSDGVGLLPLTTPSGIQIMSVNLMLEDETNPVVWRGPVIAGTVKQFWTDVIWEDVDYMFIDMPPGTGDVPLTVFQSIPLDGIVIVTTPQDLVSMIVKKAIKMANMMHIPVIGLIENMSYVVCPDCGKELHVFGQSQAEAVASEYGIPLLGRMPIDPELASLCDSGRIETTIAPYLTDAAQKIEQFCE